MKNSNFFPQGVVLQARFELTRVDSAGALREGVLKELLNNFATLFLKKKNVPHLCWFLYSLNKSMTQNAKCSFWLFFDFSHLDWTQKWFKESNSQLHPHMCQTKLYHIWWSMKRCLTDTAGSLSKNWFFIKPT